MTAAARIAILWAVAVLPTVSVAQTPAAAPVPAPSSLRYEPIAVLAVPFRDAALDPERIFQPLADDPTAERHAAALDALERHARSVISDDPRTRWVDRQAARKALERVRSFSAGVDLVRERFRLGRDLYDELRLDEAIDNLHVAESTGLSLYLDVMEPELIADIELYLGLSLLEKGRTELAHVALKRMFEVDPTRRFRRGYFPAPVEAAFVAAVVDLSAEGVSIPASRLERVDALLEEIGADVALTGFMGERNGASELLVMVYDAQARAFRVREILPIQSDGDDIERLDRALSRWLACMDARIAPVEGAAQTPSLYGRAMLDTSITHGVYFGHPTSQPFHNVGFAFNVAYQVKPQLDVFGKIHLQTAFADPGQDLQGGDLTSVRTVFGAGVSFEKGIWRGFVRPAIDIHFVGPFTVIADPNCKMWGRDHPRCPTSAITDVSSAILGGFNVSSGVAIRAGAGLYVTAQANISLYFPLLDTTDLNYLLASELGVGYTF
jgi:hypothetical protein